MLFHSILKSLSADTVPDMISPPAYQGFSPQVFRAQCPLYQVCHESHPSPDSLKSLAGVGGWGICSPPWCPPPMSFFPQITVPPAPTWGGHISWRFSYLPHLVTHPSTTTLSLNESVSPLWGPELGFLEVWFALWQHHKYWSIPTVESTLFWKNFYVYNPLNPCSSWKYNISSILMIRLRLREVKYVTQLVSKGAMIEAYVFCFPFHFSITEKGKPQRNYSLCRLSPLRLESNHHLRPFFHGKIHFKFQVINMQVFLQSVTNF